MKMNDVGIKLLQSFEGCRLTSYKDSGGILTVGWGHCGSDVKPNMTITQKQADDLLRMDLERFEKLTDKYVEQYSLNTNEFSALCSFAYNTGNLENITQKRTRTKPQISVLTAY